jgi:hypothetical protein
MFGNLKGAPSLLWTGGRLAYEYQARKLTFMVNWSHYSGDQVASAAVASGSTDWSCLRLVDT